jgi:hypothetical protein
LQGDVKTWTGQINFSREALDRINAAISVFKRDHSQTLFNLNAFSDYTSEGGNLGDYDLKSWGVKKGSSTEDYVQVAYEASWGPSGLIFTNRDAGNM